MYGLCVDKQILTPDEAHMTSNLEMATCHEG